MVPTQGRAANRGAVLSSGPELGPPDAGEAHDSADPEVDGLAAKVERGPLVDLVIHPR
jgi:hypothetical protein